MLSAQNVVTSTHTKEGDSQQPRDSMATNDQYPESNAQNQISTRGLQVVVRCNFRTQESSDTATQATLQGRYQASIGAGTVRTGIHGHNDLYPHWQASARFRLSCDEHVPGSWGGEISRTTIAALGDPGREDSDDWPSGRV